MSGNMDPEEQDANGQEHEEFEEAQEEIERPRELPADLPRSLDDRKAFQSYNQETEYYDAWQGVYNFEHMDDVIAQC